MSCSLICSDAKAQAPNWDSVYADFLKIYQPVDTPAWLFPMCFKNTFGQWDTLYFAHDDDATSILDSTLGEVKLIALDSSKFNAFLKTTSNGDTVIKYEVNNINIESNFTIKFTRGIMPLTMYWDNNAFYSDSLPYPDLDTGPRARAELWCSDGNPFNNNCPINSPLYLSDSSLNGGSFPELRIDSIYFDGNGINDEPGTLLINIFPFDDPIDAIGEQSESQNIDISPNPTSNVLRIQSESNSPFNYRMYNLLGEQVLKSNTVALREAVIITNEFKAGFYFVRIEIESTVTVQKIIKL
ncbi:MAG: T9SS type A sorting domain-containing protein [Flavobacteriales bacterium]|nr:T9SS type A sorting domain-containing protein [Flavobacteriales bacterium]